MKIGIISDSPDRIENTNKAIEILMEKGARVLIHCGDFCAPFMMEELSKFKGDVHCVFGNTDDKFTTPNRARKFGINFHGDIANLEIDGKKILVNHYPEIARAFAFTGEFDLVCYGHDHTKNKEVIGKTILLNPGGLWSRKVEPSFALYDTENNDVEFFGIE